jgi:cell division protein FtsL
VSDDKPTIEHFSEVASGLAYIGDHIAALLKAIQRDEAELQRMQNQVSELESQVERLLESARKGDR